MARNTTAVDLAALPGEREERRVDEELLVAVGLRRAGVVEAGSFALVQRAVLVDAATVGRVSSSPAQSCRPRLVP